MAGYWGRNGLEIFPKGKEKRKKENRKKKSDIGPSAGTAKMSAYSSCSYNENTRKNFCLKLPKMVLPKNRNSENVNFPGALGIGDHSENKSTNRCKFGTADTCM